MRRERREFDKGKEPAVIKDEDGTEFTVIEDSRYRIPIAIPSGIYAILERGSRNSVTTYAERQAASRKNQLMLKNAGHAKSIPDTDPESRQKTLEGIARLRAQGEAAERRIVERYGPRIVIKPLDETDPRTIRFRQEIADIFGPMDGEE